MTLRSGYSCTTANVVILRRHNPISHVLYIVTKAKMKLFYINTMLVVAGNVVIQAVSFNITAISAANNAARLECWQLAAPPVLGRGAVNFALGDFEGAFVGIIPPNTTAGSTISNAAQVQ